MLAEALRLIYPDIDLESKVIVIDDGTGPRIGVWNDPRPQPDAVAIANAVLLSVKAERIAAINAECRARLFARYGTAEEQVSRSLGIYGVAEQESMTAGIAATIDASNVAQNAVLSAVSQTEIEAVTVTWPGI